ncbi:hypothetical protein B484DRAFT_395286 [Ochromonadaceae sp. CCMP2298]|nr:hypothetical protein B484DRAFT_395286 [Ochromonadaceae sp. CCMP2298]
MFDVRGTKSRYQGSDEEKICGEVLFTEMDISIGDRRLTNIVASTSNKLMCEKIFALIELGLSPQDNPWKTIYKTLLLLNTLVLYGSDAAVGKVVGLVRFVNPLINYNSALVKRGFFSGGGTDHGAPVRTQAMQLDVVLRTDDSIRRARNDARNGVRPGMESVTGGGAPTGGFGGSGSTGGGLLDFNCTEEIDPSGGATAQMSFGQGIGTSVGAGFGLTQVPGVYEGRPDRYFDSASDPRMRQAMGGAGDVDSTGNQGISNGNGGARNGVGGGSAPAPEVDLLDMMFDGPSAQPPAQAQFATALAQQPMTDLLAQTHRHS